MEPYSSYCVLFMTGGPLVPHNLACYRLFPVHSVWLSASVPLSSWILSGARNREARPSILSSVVETLARENFNESEQAMRKWAETDSHCIVGGGSVRNRERWVHFIWRYNKMWDPHAVIINIWTDWLQTNNCMRYGRDDDQDLLCGLLFPSVFMCVNDLWLQEN